MRDHIREFLESEYQLYPSVKHDDMLDCLANIKHPDVARMLIVPVTKNQQHGQATAVQPKSYSKLTARSRK
jgi:hypothetical protein